MPGLSLGIAVVAIWIVLTGLCNFPRIGTALRRRDKLGLIPEWRFFAPRPIEADLRLVYRDSREGLRGGWTEAGSRDGRRPWHWLWNPEKRQSKAMFDAMNEINAMADLLDTPIYQPSYLLLLNMVSSYRRTLPTGQVQFAITMVYGEGTGRESAVVFLSGRHDLEAA